MSLLYRVKKLYDEQGLFELVQRSRKFVYSHMIGSTFWTFMPKSKTKKVISKSRILTTIYYHFRGTFYDEQRAILQGQALYEMFEADHESPTHSIIRNTHRIEKGLSKDDRRDVFAEGYIVNHVTAVNSALENKWGGQAQDNQVQWILDVLDEYFDAVIHTETISFAYKSYRETIDRIDYEPGDRRPFIQKNLPDTNVTSEDFRQLVNSRVSTRSFENKKVPREKIDDAILTATESPSACNRQSFQFLVFDDSKKISELGSIPGGAKGYKDDIPCLIILVGKQRAYFHDRDKHVIYIDASLAAMTLQYALVTNGLASCCINWQAVPRKQRQIQKKLNLDEDERVIMFIAVGYPDPTQMIPYSEKKSLEHIREYNRGCDK